MKMEKGKYGWTKDFTLIPTINYTLTKINRLLLNNPFTPLSQFFN